MADKRIAQLAEAVMLGKMGKGLNLKRRLGSDYEAVMKECQRVTKRKGTGSVDHAPKAKPSNEKATEPTE